MRRTLALIVLLVVIAVVPAATPLRAIAASCDTTGTPTTTVYLPNITKTLGGPTGWVTPFIVQNVGFFATTLEVSLYRFSDGALVTCRKVSSLQPATSFADVPNNDTDLPDNAQFSVVVRSFGSEVVAVVNEQQGTGGRAEALSYGGLTSGAKKVAVPYVAKQASGWLTTMVLQNLGTSDATVSAAFTSLDGSNAATLMRTIGPGRSQFIDPTVEASLSSGTEYSAILTASQPIAAVVNGHNDAAGVTHPMGFSYNGVAVGTADYTYVPLVARNTDGVGRTSRVIVQNARTASDTPTLVFASFTSGARTTLRPPSPVAPGRSWSFDVTRRPDGSSCPPGGAADCLAEGEYGLWLYGTYAVLDILLSPETAMGYTGSIPSQSRVYLPNVTRTLGGANGWTTPIVLETADAGPRSASLRWYRFADGKLVTQQVVSGITPGVPVRVDPRSVAELSDNTQYAVVLDAQGPVTAIVEELAGVGGDSAMIYEGFSSLAQAISVPTVMKASPATTTVAIGATASFSVTVTDQFGAPSDQSKWPVTWCVLPSSLGTITKNGAFTATGYGSGKVVAGAGAQLDPNDPCRWSASSAVTITVQSPAARAPAVATSVGYSYTSVTIARGTFGVYLVKQPLSSVRVKTVTDNAIDCAANCPVMPLVEYLNQTGTSMGMNGTYLCPPDYSWCAAKVNSYDYAVYNSYLGKWLNEWALVSPSNSLVTVTGKTLRFYAHTYDYDHSPVDAAISNFPMLLQGGAVINSEAIQEDHQRLSGLKGSIGTDGVYVYLALVSGATVTDSAYVLQALGVVDAMNLDGGGTSAMFADHAYRVGPGRLLPNAVVLATP